ncbi:unnamed protein product [Bursaphelenchus xylophilus]|uniref:(pine wood nematode) hypothetical protein n=1 Tax=Bursaphelenchus xylophilus TaxID=6326 RepID=A0A1I7S3L5_BURXY|nr:unnamed protein product [Bursaphelenchus xylophilus]CAG9116392.1 unnamed protein product [Bursaphelenchus xylophilus]
MEVNTEKQKKLKKRVRPKKKGIRQEIRRKIEEALLAKNSDVVDLVEPDVDGDFRASLSDVLSRLSLENMDKVGALTTAQLKSISNLSNLFEITGDDKNQLNVILKNDAKENLEEKMVYVDNLPPTCSADQLKKRASVFGNVVQVTLPQVDRLKRRSCPGMEYPINSGFGFVQFTSKVAARRFCKAYYINSHLNRGHHHRKKKTAENKDKSQPETDQSDITKLLEEAQTVAATRRKRRCTDISTSEMSGDSGGESDVPIKKAKTEGNQGNDGQEKKKRKRKKKGKLPKMTLATFFTRIQAFSFRRYKKLKDEYLELKKNSEKELKNILRPQLEDDKGSKELKAGEDSAVDENKERTDKSGKKPRARLMKTAAKVKNASFDVFRQSNV